MTPTWKLQNHSSDHSFISLHLPTHRTKYSTFTHDTHDTPSIRYSSPSQLFQSTPQKSVNMVKGEAKEVKVHFKGKEDDFIVFVESTEIVNKWKSDRTIPMVDVVGSFKVFVTHGYVFDFQLMWT